MPSCRPPGPPPWGPVMAGGGVGHRGGSGKSGFLRQGGAAAQKATPHAECPNDESGHVCRRGTLKKPPLPLCYWTQVEGVNFGFFHFYAPEDFITIKDSVGNT
jgi:hypothetical protein